ncbi:sigma factor-binding protein Crl, partial [Vibrio cholerae]|nr:sigma factor-binding protein Crl [Vibrio cholerae]
QGAVNLTQADFQRNLVKALRERLDISVADATAPAPLA